MRLEFKVYSLICGSLCVAALLLWTLITFFWCEEFDHFEQGAALENLAKLKTMITLQPEEIEKKLNDYSQWDDVYRFVQDHNRDFEKSNLLYDVLKSINIDFMIFINNKHQVIWAGALDYESTSFVPVPAPLLDLLTTNKELYSFPDPTKKKSGFLYVGFDMPFMITIHPVLPSSGKGEAKGLFVAGRLLNQQFLQRMQMISKLEVRSLYSPSVGGEPPLLTETYNKFKENILLQDKDDLFYEGKVLFKDLFGRPVFILETKLTKNLSDSLQRVSKKFNFFLLFATVFLCSLFVGILRLWIFKPLRKKSE